MKKQNLEFVKMKEGETLTGIIEGFGKNRFGIFLIIKSAGKMKALSLSPTVLKNLIKTNIQLFVKGSKIEIEKGEKPKNKNYRLWFVTINDKLLETSSTDLDIEQVKDLL